MKINPISIYSDQEEQQTKNNFIYLGSIICKCWRADIYIKIIYTRSEVRFQYILEEQHINCDKAVFSPLFYMAKYTGVWQNSIINIKLANNMPSKYNDDIMATKRKQKLLSIRYPTTLYEQYTHH